jgi:hypothetical protein
MVENWHPLLDSILATNLCKEYIIVIPNAVSSNVFTPYDPISLHRKSLRRAEL